MTEGVFGGGFESGRERSGREDEIRDKADKIREVFKDNGIKSPDLRGKLDMYIEQALQGKSAELDRMYKNFVLEEDELIARRDKVLVELKDQSEELFDKVRNIKPGKEFIDTPERLLLDAYLKLCRRENIPANYDFFLTFLDDEGWELVEEDEFAAAARGQYMH